jgi:pyruvate/2-oxoacid:ferredoxin oxidoreductase alpha subunit
MTINALTRKAIELHKTASHNTYDAVVAVQEQAESTINALFNKQTPWLPEEGKKVMVLWGSQYKKERDEFKTAVEERYKKIESLISEL